MDLQKLAQLAKSNPSAAKAFLNKKKIEKPEAKPVSKTSSFPNKKKEDRTLKINDRVFTEKQLDTIVRALVSAEVSKIPKPKDGKTPSRDELQKIITPLIPVVRQPKDGKDGEVSQKHIDDITNRILKQVSKTPDLTEAIVNVFKQEKVKAEDLPGFTELKERVEKLARNQQYMGGRGIASGYTDSDVRRVIAADGGLGGEITVTEEDGSPSVSADTIKFPNGTVTDNGDGSVSYVPSGSGGDVTAAAAFANDNRLIRSDGTGKGVQASGITVDDTDNVSGLGTLASASGTLTIDETTALSDKQDVLAEGAFVDGDKTKLDGIETSADVTDATNVGSAINGATAKTTPVDVDAVPLIDSAASNVLKKVTWANVKATLKTYFDTLYHVVGGTDVPVADGGTGASTASGARTNLGLVIGTDVQAYDAGLTSIAGLTTTADRMIYTTASDTYAVTPLTSAARSILDDTSTANIRTTLGVGTGQSPQFTAVNIGNATDTTLGRTSAGIVNVEGSPLPRIFTGTAAPATTPGQVGDVFIDTTNDNSYVSVGTASSADWVQTNGAGGGDAWSDPVDADIVPDGNGTRNIGSGTNFFEDAYINTFRSSGQFGAYVDGVRVVAFEGLGTDGLGYLTISSSETTGDAVLVGALGSATNIPINLQPKGSGEVQVNGQRVLDETDLAGTTLTGTTTVDRIDYNKAVGTVVSGGNLGATETINWNSSTHFTGTLDSNITISFSNAVAGQTITLYLAYDATAQRTITWPTTTWLDNSSGAAPATPAASGNVLVVTYFYDGTTYYGSATGNYAVYS